jgi:hypothetical protein
MLAQAGLLADGCPGILFPAASTAPSRAWSLSGLLPWRLPNHSGGTAAESHGLPYSPVDGHLGYVWAD